MEVVGSRAPMSSVGCSWWPHGEGSERLGLLMTPLGCIRVKMTLTAHACLVVLSGGYIHPPGKYPPTHPPRYEPSLE